MDKIKYYLQDETILEIYPKDVNNQYFMKGKIHFINNIPIHRLDGPAVIFPRSKSNAWVINGVHYNSFSCYLTAIKPYVSEEDIIILRLKYNE